MWGSDYPRPDGLAGVGEVHNEHFKDLAPDVHPQDGLENAAAVLLPYPGPRQAAGTSLMITTFGSLSRATWTDHEGFDGTPARTIAGYPTLSGPRFPQELMPSRS